MKKIRLVIFGLLLLIIPNSVYAEEILYDDASKGIKEVMQAWYMRGSYGQYNVSKNTYNTLRHPEDFTSQDNGYSVCSGFTNDVYKETFGTSVKENNVYSSIETPKLANQYAEQTGSYISLNNCKSDVSSNKCNGEYALFYAKKNLMVSMIHIIIKMQVIFLILLNI